MRGWGGVSLPCKRQGGTIAWCALLNNTAYYLNRQFRKIKVCRSIRPFQQRHWRYILLKVILHMAQFCSSTPIQTQSYLPLIPSPCSITPLQSQQHFILMFIHLRHTQWIPGKWLITKSMLQMRIKDGIIPYIKIPVFDGFLPRGRGPVVLG